jgi:environmental stress-induced protein Ves
MDKPVEGYRVLRSSSHRTSRWAGGETTEIAIFPPAASFSERNFECRISTATVMQPGPFTLLPGYHRILYLLEGNGMELHFAGAESERREILQHPFDRVEFSGSDNVSARLLDGPVRDFNVIYAEGSAVRVSPLLGDAEYRMFEHGRPCVVVCLSGTLHVSLGSSHLNIEKFDAFIVESPPSQSNEIAVRRDRASAFGVVIEL